MLKRLVNKEGLHEAKGAGLQNTADRKVPIRGKTSLENRRRRPALTFIRGKRPCNTSIEEEGGDRLTLSKAERGREGEPWIGSEEGSKNRKGGIQHTKVENIYRKKGMLDSCQKKKDNPCYEKERWKALHSSLGFKCGRSQKRSGLGRHFDGKKKE